MKVCNSCALSFDSTNWQCPGCLAEPEMIEKYPAFSPGLALANEGFNADYYKELFHLESGNFWFRSRNNLILDTLKRYFPRAASLFEIGCVRGSLLIVAKKPR